MHGTVHAGLLLPSSVMEPRGPLRVPLSRVSIEGEAEAEQPALPCSSYQLLPMASWEMPPRTLDPLYGKDTEAQCFWGVLVLGSVEHVSLILRP